MPCCFQAVDVPQSEHACLGIKVPPMPTCCEWLLGPSLDSLVEVAAEGAAGDPENGPQRGEPYPALVCESCLRVVVVEPAERCITRLATAVMSHGWPRRL